MKKFNLPIKSRSTNTQSTPHGWIATFDYDRSFLFQFDGNIIDLKSSFWASDKRVIMVNNRASPSGWGYYTINGTVKDHPNHHLRRGGLRRQKDAWVIPKPNETHKVLLITTRSEDETKQALMHALGIKNQALVVFNNTGEMKVIDPVPDESLRSSFMSHDNATIFFTTNKSVVIIDNPLV